MILKYEYDKAKKDAFLSFWQIDNLESYSKKVKDFPIYLSYFTKLSRQEQRSLVEILLYAERKRELRIEDGRLKIENQKRIGMPINQWTLRVEQASHLDDAHFISIVKDRSQLNTVRDIAYLTKDVLDFFKRLHFFKNYDQIPHFNIKSIALPNLNETLFEIAKEYLSFNAIPTRNVKELLNHPEIVPCISPQYLFCLYLNVEEEMGIRHFEGMENKKAQERLAYLVHHIDAYLYNKQARHHKFLQKINEKHLSLEEEETNNLIEKLLNLNISHTFHRLPFWHKVNVIFRIVLSEHLDLAEELLILEEAKVYHPVVFCRLLNKFRLQAKKVPFSGDLLATLIQKLKYLGLIDSNEEGYSIEKRSLIRMWRLMPDKKKNTSSKLLKNEAKLDELEDRILIDTDMQMTIYRTQAIPEVFYLILTIGQLSLDEHVITASWDMSRNTFSEVIGMGPDRLHKWLKLAAPSTFNENVSNYVKSYFTSSNGIEEIQAYVLKAFSKNAFERMSYALKETGIVFVNLGKIEGKHAILLSKKRHYVNAKKLLNAKKLNFF